MPFHRFKGLRFEILGNLGVVAIIALLLTGFGVWFINGRHMLQQNLLQGTVLVQSLSKEILSRANETLSLSKLTLTHEMSRLLLLEQLYRAFTIMRGEKYHK